MFENEKCVRLAREMAKAYQDSDLFKELMALRERNDNDQQLQNDIAKFNLLRMKMENENAKEDRDEDVLDLYSEQLRDVYEVIMNNENMAKYSALSQKLERLQNYIFAIARAGFTGEDADAVSEQDACTHDCSTCGGCH